MTAATPSRAIVTTVGIEARAGDLGRPDEGQPDEPGDEGDAEQDGPEEIHSAGPARRLPAGERRPRRATSATIPIGTLR